MFHKKVAKQGRRRPNTTSVEATPNVFSYHASRSQATGKMGRSKQEEQERPASLRKPKPPLLKRTVQVVAFLVVGAVVVSNLLIASVPKVIVVGADDTFLRDQSAYQEAARKIFASSVLNSNKLTVDVEDIRAQLKAAFPELADASISLPVIGRQPVLYIQPSTSRILMHTKSGEPFILDGSGKAIVGGEQAAGLQNIGLPAIRDESGLSVKLGSIVMPSANVAFITEVARQLKAKDMVISEAILPAASSELHVRVQGVPYLVKFNTRGNAREETGAFLATKQYVESQNKAVAEYIDVRVDNRAYYR